MEESAPTDVVTPTEDMFDRVNRLTTRIRGDQASGPYTNADGDSFTITAAEGDRQAITFLFDVEDEGLWPEGVTGPRFSVNVSRQRASLEDVAEGKKITVGDDENADLTAEALGGNLGRLMEHFGRDGDEFADLL